MSREKMLSHLARAEEAQAEVDGYERAVDRLVEDKYRYKLGATKSPGERQGLKLHYVKKESENHTRLHSAISRRNSHREWAQTYALSLLAEEAVTWVEPSM
jgi:hypothetical protein